MGSYKIWLDDNYVIHGMLEGVHTREDAENVIKDVFALADDNGNLNRLIVDMSMIEHSTMGARRVHAENMKTDRMKNWKVALIGGNIVTRIMANFIIRVSGSNEIFQLFEIEKDALNWVMK